LGRFRFILSLLNKNLFHHDSVIDPGTEQYLGIKHTHIVAELFNTNKQINLKLIFQITLDDIVKTEKLDYHYTCDN